MIVVVVLLVTSCANGNEATDSPDNTPRADSTPGPNETPPPGPTPTATLRPGETPTPAPTLPVPTHVDDNGFDDHSVPEIASVGEYFALARRDANGLATVKFVIPNMLEDADVHWMNSNFYSLHDEWYWFRFLNNQPVPSALVRPIDVGPFATIAAIYAWAESIDTRDLPGDLRFADSNFSERPRLYSNEFYNLALDVEPRNYGIGSVVFVPTPANAAGGQFVIELEFTDDPAPDEIARFFEVLTDTLPSEIGTDLSWVVRSPNQERTAQKMAAADLPYNDRVVRFSELVEPGVVAVYNPGIAAGRLLLIEEGGSQLADATDTDILIVEHVPDWLPPASALISSNPQTPLAHVNLLARNRGIPNASQAGIVDDPGIRQAARVRAHAIVRAEGEELVVTLISGDEYREWTALLSEDSISVPPTTRAMPLTIDLRVLSERIENESDLSDWRPIIGGKAAGFLALLATEGVSTPDDPLTITVGPYLEHLEGLDDALHAMLNDPDFATKAKARFLLLEGPKEFADFYTSANDDEFARDFADSHPPGTTVGNILAAGGFMDLFGDTPMNPQTLEQIVQRLSATYGDYAATQGLRFRSSSSVEDIEGFSGAGLYDSNTGFFEPEDLDDENDRKKSIERAIKKTWASYWGFEAYEERRREKVDHLSGAMAVLVHARFDDPLELNNGVATLTLLPSGSQDDALIVVNVQQGAVSVTNPDPTERALPEIIEVRLRGPRVMIERLSESTLAAGTAILSDTAVMELVTQLESTTLLWRDRINGSLSPEQRVQTVTLDFEFKTMDDGWPALRSGPEHSGRLVIKQARSLDPGLRGMQRSVLDLPIGRDILARARLVERVRCSSPEGTRSAIETLTDPLLLPDVGFSEVPHVVLLEPGAGTEANCTRTTLFSTPAQFLFELLEAGTPLNLT